MEIPPAARMSRRATLAVNVVAIVLLQSTYAAITGIMPVVALREFHADDWQSVFITASISVLSILSIFWNAVLERMPLRRYLLLYWCAGLLPLGLIGQVHNYWQLLALYVIGAIGNAGWMPVYGNLLKRFYRDSSRGRAFGVLFAASLLGSAAGSFAIGEWMNADPAAFRIYMPIAAIVQLAGVGVLLWLAQRNGVNIGGVENGAEIGAAAGDRARSAGESETPGSFREQRPARMGAAEQGARMTLRTDSGGPRPARGADATNAGPRLAFAGVLRRVIEPVTHMREILKSDHVFYRYEAAFMTYGIGWMVSYALLPLIVTRKLHMNYPQVASSTLVAYQLSVVAASFVAGWATDRLGAARTTAYSFFALSLYPIGLMLAQSVADVRAASILYGITMAGVNLGWMIGPVTLAPTPDKTPQYMAIHTTLVGLRGTLFQFLGMALYRLTDSFVWPLLIAAAAFLAAAVQMWALRTRFGARGVVVRTRSGHAAVAAPAADERTTHVRPIQRPESLIEAGVGSAE